MPIFTGVRPQCSSYSAALASFSVSLALACWVARGLAAMFCLSCSRSRNALGERAISLALPRIPYCSVTRAGSLNLTYLFLKATILLQKCQWMMCAFMKDVQPRKERTQIYHSIVFQRMKHGESFLVMKLLKHCCTLF